MNTTIPTIITDEMFREGMNQHAASYLLYKHDYNKSYQINDNSYVEDIKIWLSMLQLYINTNK